MSKALVIAEVRGLLSIEAKKNADLRNVLAELEVTPRAIQEIFRRILIVEMQTALGQKPRYCLNGLREQLSEALRPPRK
ncbi:MAG: hypothetical protein N4A65_01145 [Cohaesibacter sp.]|jgi:hypothetical protein|nr:hypothetical protein [Cohaesibacter sp.]